MHPILKWSRAFAASFRKSPLAFATLAFGLMLLLASFGFYWLELRPKGQDGFFSALYWAVVTLTTVGYGDFAPSTASGRVLGMIVMGSGVVLLSALSANLASLLVERKAKKRMGLLQVNLYRHIVILGWNQLGSSLVRTLIDSAGQDSAGQDNANIVLVGELGQDERDELSYQFNLGDRLHFVNGPPSQKSIQAKAGVDRARIVYILSQEGLPPEEADQQSIFAALTLRSLAPKVPAYGEAMLATSREHMLRAGITEILARGETGHHILGLMGTAPSVLPFFQSVLGLGGKRLLRYRRLNSDERQLQWGQFLANERSRKGSLPLALCKESKDFNLQDMLDESSALDQFVLELFAASGRSMDLGHTVPEVLVNPGDQQRLADYDGILLLDSVQKGGEK